MASLGDGVSGFAVGDEVCALVAGGGYAERVPVPAGQVMPLPPGVDVVTAGGVPEVACTVWSTVVRHAGLAAGELMQIDEAGVGSEWIVFQEMANPRVACGNGPKCDGPQFHLL